MKKIIISTLIILSLFSLNLQAYSKDYTKNSEVKKFMSDMIYHHGFNKSELTRLFKRVKVQESALNFYKKPKSEKKKTKPNGSWDRYERIMLTSKRIDLGVEFMQKHKKRLSKAYRIFGVQPEYITAIIGIESFYGGFTGNSPVFDSLVTLAFEKNRRNKFFKSELKAFLKLAKSNKQNPKSYYGSFAGAMGLAQFMPSNFKKLAVDFNRDGKLNLFEESDAIGSIANYFRKSGWNRKVPVATRVSYQGKRFDRFKTGFKYKYKRSTLKGIKPKSDKFYYPKKVHLIKLDRRSHDELWYGTQNFYVITRYNRSNYYAMAVHQLAQKIRKAYKQKNI